MMDGSIRFSGAIARTPGRTVIDGVTSAALGKPDYHAALQQHGEYLQVLEHCGLHVTVMPSAEQYPDSVFIEDCAVLADRFAVIARTGIASRRGEEKSVQRILKNIYDDIAEIKAPGTLEGGDVLRVGGHFYVGMTARTNEAGIAQLSTILQKSGYSVTAIAVEKMLHLKTGVAYLGDDTVVVAGELIGHQAFSRFRRITVDPDESYAANCVRINDRVVMPCGYTKTRKAIERLGYHVVETDVSEFMKIDGGISCLSLRIPLTGAKDW